MTIKFVLVGCGHIAQRHAYHICGHANAELIGVCDLDSEKANMESKPLQVFTIY